MDDCKQKLDDVLDLVVVVTSNYYTEEPTTYGHISSVFNCLEQVDAVYLMAICIIGHIFCAVNINIRVVPLL